MIGSCMRILYSLWLMAYSLWFYGVSDGGWGREVKMVVNFGCGKR